jgi:hypothetical protein
MVIRRGDQPSRRLLWVLVAAAGCGAALASATALATTVQSGNLRVSFAGSLSPQRLPRTSRAPVALRLSGSISTVDGSHVPPVRTVSLALNRHGVFDTAGIPICDPASLVSTLTGQARRICGPALLGSGRVSGEVALPLQPPFVAHGPLLIFNGGTRRGEQRLVMQVFAHIPAPTTFVTTALVRRVSAELGSRIEVKVPSIAAGQGSLTEFEATFRRGIAASCPAPKPLKRALYPFAKATLGFATGTVLRRCMVGP